MKVTEALESRQSFRAFRPDPIDRELLLKILGSACRTPSWANTQPWEVFVAGGEALDRLREAYTARFDQGVPGSPDLPVPGEWPAELKKRMVENAAQRFTAMGIDRSDSAARRASFRRNFEFFGSPAVVFLCFDRTLTPWSIFDTGMMAQSIMLAALEYGVNSVPAVNLVAYPDLIRQELGIPEDLFILIGLALGYGDPENPANKPRSLRRPVSEVVRLKGF